MATFRISVLLSLLICTACSSLPKASEAKISLQDISLRSKATVLFWWATECPCVSRYQSRIEDLKARYTKQGVNFIAVSSNSDDDSAKNAKVAKARSFDLPILNDDDGQLANKLGVRTTPTVVLVDQDGEVKYQGWIDNERFPREKGRIAYLEDAIKDLLGKSKISTASSPIYGCRVTRKLL